MKKYAFVLCFFCITKGLWSQVNVDLILKRDLPQSRAEIFLRPDALLGGLVTNLQFTIEGEFAAPQPGSLQQDPAVAQWLTLTEAGDVQSEGGIWRQKYVAFGFTDIAQPIQPGEERRVMTLSLPASLLSVRISSGSWAEQNNGVFYVEVQGIPATGLTESPLLSESPVYQSFDLYPNPAGTLLHLRSERVLPGTPVYIRDIAGRLVHTLVTAGSDTLIDVSRLASGLYTVSCGGEIRLLQRE